MIADVHRQALKEAVESALTLSPPGDAGPGLTPATASEIEAELEREPADEVRQRDVVKAVMTLPERAQGIPALERFVRRAAAALDHRRAAAPPVSPVTLAELLAATILATLGDRAGVPLLTSVRRVVVDVDITHASPGDLVVQLIGPDGKTVTLSNRQPGPAGDPVTSTLHMTRSFVPEGAAGGTWQLLVRDLGRTGVGAINSFSLTITSAT
jgi:hypothetical protein